MLFSSSKSRSIAQQGARHALAVPIVCLLIVALRQASPAAEALELGTKSDNSPTTRQNQQLQRLSANDQREPASGRKQSLEAALEDIVQLHDTFDMSDRSLAEAIISRLMMEDAAKGPSESLEADGLLGASDAGSSAPAIAAPEQQQFYYGRTNQESADPMRLKKLLSMVQAYESSLRNGPGAAGPTLPLLPGGQAATSKRAAARLAGTYQQHQANSGSQAAYGGRPNSYDFGLGKRPDTAGASSNLLRLGDSLSGGGGGGIPAASQFGKRPSAHRYDFGLGKRVASSAYPRYDFGLGKRAPNRIRYDFGLGK